MLSVASEHDVVARLSRGGERTFHGISMRKIEHFRHLHVVRNENVIQGVNERIVILDLGIVAKFGSLRRSRERTRSPSSSPA